MQETADTPTPPKYAAPGGGGKTVGGATAPYYPEEVMIYIFLWLSYFQGLCFPSFDLTKVVHMDFIFIFYVSCTTVIFFLILSRFCRIFLGGGECKPKFVQHEQSV